jgi:biopolymer transport protein ExbD
MAIRFRCQHCHTLQSITSRKAGKVVKCAACDEDVVVPLEDQGDALAQPPPNAPFLDDVPKLKDDAPPKRAVASPRAAEEVKAPAAETARAKPAPTIGFEAEDRVALPDDFFEFEPAERSSRRETFAPPVNVVPEEESVAFATYDELNVTSAKPDEVSAPACELPPLRGRGEEFPEQFTLPIRKSSIDDEMDLTPMVDVVFQLLIFFMVTASFALHKTIQTPTPDPEQKGATQSIQSLEELEGVAILVRIDGQNGITIDDEPLSDASRIAEALQTKMRHEQKSEIIITADSAAWHRTVVKVVDAANEAGMQKIRLATRSGPAE